MPGRVYQNDAPALSLASSLAAGATTIPVNQSITDVETPISYTINSGGANQEIVTLVDKNTSTSPSQFENCVRGCDGTADQSHSSGEVLTHEATARDFDQNTGILTPVANSGFPSSYEFMPGKHRVNKNDQDRIYFTPIPISGDVVIDGVAFDVSTGGSTDGTTDIRLFSSNENGIPTPNLELLQILSTSLSSSGYKKVTGLNYYAEAGLYWMGAVHTGYTTTPETLVFGKNAYTYLLPSTKYLGLPAKRFGVKAHTADYSSFDVGPPGSAQGGNNGLIYNIRFTPHNA